jgi:putative toxin-antitoxin system antitoxin component (TIGR02293 family)
MSDTLTQGSSQDAFESALRKHLAGYDEADVTVPDVNGVRAGIQLAALDEVRERLGLNQETLERTLCVSARTLQRRRRGEQRLTPAESDRLWRLLHIFHRALQAFGGDVEAARAWLTMPKPLLHGETPLDRLDTEPGLREVEDMLTVIDETAAA